MDFIRNFYERVLLVVVSLALLAFSALIIRNVAGFGKTFESVRGEVVGSKEIDTIDTSALDHAVELMKAPATWVRKGPLLVSRPHIEQEGRLINPEDQGYDLHPPIPNKWIIDNELDLLDPNILNEDGDGDGFTVLEEWKAGTNPQDAASAPPYHNKLRLAEYISRPFRLLFAAYTGDRFQINTIDVSQPSQFLRVGEPIAGTKFKVASFEQKTRPNPRTGATDDISELTLENTDTGEKIVLVVEVTGNSPDSFGKFRYLKDGSEFSVKRGANFKLPPDNIEYNLVDISREKAVIKNLKSGEEVTVPRMESP